MPTPETPAAPRNTEKQLVGQTFTLWLWPYFCLREEARPVVSGLTKAKADEIMEREKDRAPGVMFLELDDVSYSVLCVSDPADAPGEAK